TALTFHARDADELAERLKELLDDRADARGLADSALALLGQDHSPARMAEELAQMYGRIVAAPTPP
ncbi:hypothetical protein LCGC14_2767430, partial [marine sediment metagenome]